MNLWEIQGDVRGKFKEFQWESRGFHGKFIGKGGIQGISCFFFAE
jgi:hypothetical protein